MISTVIGCILMNLAVAVSEEFLFRGVILNAFLNSWKTKRNFISAAVIASCIIFGLRHLINLYTTPASIFATCAQVFFTFMAGTYLCAVYLRSQNIWVCILIHFLEDFSTSIWTLFSSHAAASAAADISPMAALGMIAMQIPYLIFAVLMLRDKNWRFEENKAGTI
jgi:membrane protease YdiL (CAAX protease family)